MSHQPILLILGAGPNIGHHVAAAFASRGYRIALASRTNKSPPPNTDHIHIPVDLSKPETVPQVFETVKEKFGAAPGVVVYNGAHHAPEKDKTDPLASLDFGAYNTSHNVNTVSPLIAAREAVKGFKTLPDGAGARGAVSPKTFIFTGNILNLVAVPGLMTFGMTKGAMAYAVRGLVEGAAYKGDGIRFYYADERSASGGPVYNNIDGEAAAEEYVRLAEMGEQGPWLDTFVKGKGYQDFGMQPKM